MCTSTTNNRCGGAALWTAVKLCTHVVKSNKQAKTCGLVKPQRAVAELTLCAGSGEQRREVFPGIARKGLQIIFGLFLQIQEK